MNSSRNTGQDEDYACENFVLEDYSQDIIAYLKHRIHKPLYNVFTQYCKRRSGKEFNWWKENQFLI
ncbi:MAG: hypothetical protein JXR41_10445 [Bacteroidales bacterium]|nr:hypothetical protein [Bacteroidales bacterium]MBN2763500.1 hypothetical protein [Bacteroidales bacterium]